MHCQKSKYLQFVLDSQQVSLPDTHSGEFITRTTARLPISHEQVVMPNSFQISFTKIFIQRILQLTHFRFPFSLYLPHFQEDINIFLKNMSQYIIFSNHLFLCITRQERDVLSAGHRGNNLLSYFKKYSL